MKVLGAPVRSPDFLSTTDRKLSEFEKVLKHISKIPDARIAFHVHGMTAAV